MSDTSATKTEIRVIIVGGSVAGLTLAHCLAKANISHVVLEKRAEISPQEGAFLGIWPNGGRIFDQLGVYADLEQCTVPIHTMRVRFPDGFSFSSELPRCVQERFGYPIVSLDRQKVLEILHDRYPAKSNIHINKRVTEIRQTEREAQVVTDDGAVYKGDLVVGADGIHSAVRAEMWRQAKGLVGRRDGQAFAVEYACVFGISTPIPGLESGEHVNSYSDGLCVITFHGKDGRIFWFILIKLHKRFVYPKTPRFSASDAAKVCAEYASVPVWGEICVRDLWRNKTSASMTALEEGLLKTWNFKRVVLLGDSIHKMTPNIGQGANTAAEDAAVLASLLQRLSTSASSTTSGTIDAVLREYVSLRYKRVKSTYQRAYFGARLHTRDNVLKCFVGRYIFPRFSQQVLERTSQAIAGAPLVDFLPTPKRSGAGWSDYAGSPEVGAPTVPWLVISLPVLASVLCYLMFA
ncbi:ausM [Aspergillus calidoustus]|uniref:FAD-dependent monooxygenase ausM n=1 Tax=Aspergillus calidoustus TaxID=454130 RepID=AUSM_ASPCI|nr:RecName: Full=FAD-dependent monooxygenase ausM; AltName: Full=Austinoid biosynthesis cluster protein M [Aspergillus calidoustus]CEL11273.1 ausM [Aspergillus calidoustus]